MSRNSKLAPEVNRALYVKNLSYSVSTEELFDLFGKFGPVRQIRQGIATTTKGTAFVVYEDVLDAKAACDKLNGFNFQNRYLVVLYHQIEKSHKAQAQAQAQAEAQAQAGVQHPNANKDGLAERRDNLAQLKREHGIVSAGGE